MERYSSYKDSGISWIGEIPEHWEVCRMKRVFSEAKEKNTTESGTLLSLSQYTGITLKDDAKKVGMFEAESTIGYNVVHPGQFVMNIMLAWNGSYAVSDYEGIISPSYCVFNFNEDCEKKYFHYLLRLPAYAGAFKTMSKGIIESRLRLYPIYFLAFKTIIPPQDEQRAIVSYLEDKTSKIDAYVSEKEKEILLLQELKQKTIADAVTKGLNSDVKMKDSGISWIGEIPEHWNLRRIKYILSELKEKSETGLETPLSLSKEGGVIPFSEKKNRTMESASYVGGKIVHDGEIVFNRFRARLFAISHYNGIVSSDYAVYKCQDSASSDYMVKLFGTDMYREAFNRKASGIGDGFNRLYTDDLFSMYAIFPPLDEQRAIVSYIEEKCQKIDSLTTELQAEIDHLKEYKQRLIADVVTGQVNVQNH